MRKIQLGIIGCGMIGKSFIRSTLQSPYFEVRGFFDRNTISQQAAQAITPHAILFSSQEALVESPDIEALLICTRHTDHAMQAAYGLTCGKHVLIEKPIATNLEELSFLLDAQLKHPECIVTALPHGQDPLLNEARQWIQELHLGKLVAFHSYLDVPGPPRSNWYYSSSAVGGASLDTLPYALIRLLSFLKCDVKFAVGFKNQLIRNRACLDGKNIKPEVDDNASLILEFDKGQQAIVRSSWNTSHPEDYLVIRGRKADLWMDCWRQTLTLVSDGPPIYPDCTDLLWQNRKAYQKQFPSVNGEELKLDVFFNHIKSGKGNLLEVAYGMEILLQCLFTDKNTFFAPSFYKTAKESASLLIGEHYI